MVPRPQELEMVRQSSGSLVGRVILPSVYLSRFSTFVGPGSPGTIRSRPGATLTFEQAHREGGVAGASAPGPGGPKGPLKKIKLV